MSSELVQWGDKLLSLSHITAGIEQQFVAYCKNKLLMNAKQFMEPSDFSRYSSFLCSGNEFWNEGGMSTGVFGLFQNDVQANKELLKMCFGKAVLNMTPAQFDELYATALVDGSSLQLAWEQVIKKRFGMGDEVDAEKKSATPSATTESPGGMTSSPS